VTLPTLASFRFDGRQVLSHVIAQSEFGSVEQAVASLTAFAHPDTVRQTACRNIFRTVRRRQQADVGKFFELESCGRVMMDDNRSPAVAFEWAHGIRERPDVQVNHLWARSQDVAAYTSLANLCLTPSFLAKLTDTDEKICALLKYRAFSLYGYSPSDLPAPDKPVSYDAVEWAPTLPAVDDLQSVYRRAVASKRKDRVVVCARELGWLFSGFEPDASL